MLCDISDIGVIPALVFCLFLSVDNRIIKGCSPDTGVRNKTGG